MIGSAPASCIRCRTPLDNDRDVGCAECWEQHAAQEDVTVHVQFRESLDLAPEKLWTNLETIVHETFPDAGFDVETVELVTARTPASDTQSAKYEVTVDVRFRDTILILPEMTEAQVASLVETHFPDSIYEAESVDLLAIEGRERIGADD